MHQITPHLWYAQEAREAATLYTSLFAHSTITNTVILKDTPSGDCEVVSFQLAGQPFKAISGGPHFRFTPAVSFLVLCDTPAEVDQLWHTLSQGGKALMPLNSYPFSRRYGWTEDRYGLSWQIMYRGELPMLQKITPVMMFSGALCGKAASAIQYYTSIFKNSTIHTPTRYEKGDAPDEEGTIKFGSFVLNHQYFAAMDSARVHDAPFNEAISFMVSCKDQAAIEYYWEMLSAVPAAEQCGWLKDRYGFSWQIVPDTMDALLNAEDPEKTARITQAFLKMKKFDLSLLN